MKSLNTKKIVALAAGATLLGSALLGAGAVSFGNTELINANGVPQAKVVVGAAAKASDGVAAANIAAVLGNLAFKQATVTATPTGLDGLTCAAGGAGSCEVLSKSVTLEVTTPAGVIPAGAYGFETYISDYIDLATKNRAEDKITGSPWDGNPGTQLTALKITGSNYPPLKDYVVHDTHTGNTYDENQYLYVKSDKVYFSNDVDGDFRSENTQVAYEIVFGNDGLPVCGDSQGGDWAYCKNPSHASYNLDKATENHRVKIMYLGEEWVVSEMSDYPSTAGAGGKIKLAKESAYSPKLQIGESLDLGDGNKLVLGDLKPASGGQPNDLAIFSIKNSAGEEIANKVVAQGSTTEIAAGGNTYRVRVYQAAPGYTLAEKWAEVAVFSNEITLENGQKIDDTNNKDFKARLIWKDRDAASPTMDALHKIQIYLTRTGQYTNMNPGDSIDVLKVPARWRFTFSGNKLQDKDYVPVTFSLEGAGGFSYDHTVTASNHSASSGPTYYTGPIGSTSAKVIRVSANSKIFKFLDNGNNEIVTDEFIYAPVSRNLTTTHTAYTTSPVVLVDVGGDYVPVQDAASGQMTRTYAQGWKVKYNFGGAEYPMYFQLGMYDGSTDSPLSATGELTADGYYTVYVSIGEDAGNSNADWLGIRAIQKTQDSVGTIPKNSKMDFEFDFSGTTDGSEENYVIYKSYTPAPFGLGAKTIAASETAGDWQIIGSSSKKIEKDYYYTDRGSYVDSADTGSGTYGVTLAKDVATLAFMWQSVSAEAQGSMTETYSNLKEGDVITLSDGVKVKVKSIDVKTGSCTAGAASVSGLDKVSCQLNVADRTKLGERQNVPADLVVLDTNAGSPETVVSVGGDQVNTVTKAILSGTPVKLEKAGDVVVQEIGNGKIVVAGYTAEDTMTAASTFIAKLKG
ncbi:MAG: S-layer protein [Candidatus Micrarchaeota archaeon]|nr:S-layer protein [Candidatus Micrarchaeota archaeon]